MNRADHECVRLCLDGHPEAFRELVERYQGPLLAYLGGRLGGAERAEEAAQEAFVRSYFTLSKLRKPGSFFPWLCGIAGRVAKEAARRRAREKGDPADLGEVRDDDPRGSTRDLDLEAAVAALAPPYRDVILLRFYGGLSCGEVGERLGLKLGTVTKRLSRAYAMLREKLERPQRGAEVER
ncbi:MAG: RNA polymerase sigma factor [Planctomycetota bacterium]|jgi:RNA polymerase sigma-70 factor (ECF subfamily)